MDLEYIIFGKSNKNPKIEGVLLSQINSLEKAKELEALLIDKHGCFETRIQILDWDTNINHAFIKAINI